MKMIGLTYFGANGWLLEFDETSILIDPWLRGELNFKPGDWLIKGMLTTEWPIPKSIDIILLTQGLEDHSHPETLDILDKNIKVIGSPSALEVVKKKGYANSQCLKPGEIRVINDIQILATKGAKLQTQENGYLIRHTMGTVYIEPHGYIDNNVINQKIDYMITPVVNLEIPILGSFIKGKTALPTLIEKFNPDFILASTTGGNIKFQGFLSKYIKQIGSIELISDSIPDNVTLIDPIPGFKYTLGKQ